MNGTGIINSEKISIGGSLDPFETLVDTLKPTTPIVAEKEEAVVEDKPKTIKEKEVVSATPVQKDSAALNLYQWYKEKGVDIGDVDDAVTPEQVLERVQAKMNEDAESRAEEKKKKEGWDDSLKNYALMLKQGLSPADQTELSNLNLLANVKFDIDTEDGRDDAVLSIREMLKQKLSGKQLEKAIAAIDPYSDDFEEEFKDANAFWVSKRNEFEKGKLDEIKSKQVQEETMWSSVKAEIEKDETLTKAQKDKALKGLFESTEVVKDANGVRKVTNYDKNLLDIMANPAKLAKLMRYINDNMSDEAAVQKGKGLAGQELAQKIAGQLVYNGYTKQDTQPKPLKSIWAGEKIGTV
jgi:hypothetical protein